MLGGGGGEKQSLAIHTLLGREQRTCVLRKTKVRREHLEIRNVTDKEQAELKIEKKLRENFYLPSWPFLISSLEKVKRHGDRSHISTALNFFIPASKCTYDKCAMISLKLRKLLSLFYLNKYLMVCIKKMSWSKKHI